MKQLLKRCVLSLLILVTIIGATNFSSGITKADDEATIHVTVVWDDDNNAFNTRPQKEDLSVITIFLL